MQNNQAETATNTPSFQIPKAYLRYVRFLEAISFKLSSKEIRKRFFTPIPFPTPKRELPFVQSAKVEVLPVGERQITLHTVGTGEKRVLFIHGWSGRGSQAYAIAPALVEAGYSVTTITAQAHGDNPGKRTHMLEFKDAILKAVDHIGPIHTLMAHSIGGAAAFNAVAGGLKPTKLIILGAPSSITDVIIDFCNRLKLDERYVDYLKTYLKNNYSEDIEAIAPRVIAHKIDVPGLIVHDKQDIDVHYEQAEALHENWQGSKLILTDGLGHRRILSDEGVIGELIKFISLD